MQGHCESGFGRVADVFAAQLKSGRDIGGSVGVYRDGKPVVTIWGGSAHPGHGVPWAEHTITPIGSTGKALASTALLILVDRGLIDLDEPVASYWPAFSQNGKAEIPVRLVLSHRSGVAALDVPISTVSFDDHEELVRYEVEDASSGALGNGPSLARMFAALIGEVDGRRLISRDLMNAARQPQASGDDVVLRMRTDWGLGFALPGGPMWPDVGVPGIFGHTGASGSLAFADPEHRLAFGYTPNLWAELSGSFRAPRFRFQALTQAVYESAGVRMWPHV